MRQWQYLDFVEPVLPTTHVRVPEVPVVQPRRATLTTAVLATTLFAFVPVVAHAVTPSVAAWGFQFSEPTRVRCLVSGETGAERPIHVPRFAGQLDWYAPLSEPLRGPRVLISGDTLAERPIHVPRFAGSLAWWTPLSEPLARARCLVSGDTGAERPIHVPRFAGQLDWYTALSDPLRLARGLTDSRSGGEQPVLVPAPVVVTLSWYAPLSEPLRRVRGLVDDRSGAEQPIAVPAPVLVHLGWYQPLSEPIAVRVLIDPRTGAEFPVLPIPVVGQVIDWYQPLSLPIPARFLVDPSTGAEFVVLPRPFLSLAWYQPLSVPVLRTPFFRSETGAEFPKRYVPAPTPLVTGIRRLRRSPHLTEEQAWQFFERFQLEIQAGVGLPTGQGTDPQLMLRWSNNGGKTWSEEHWVSAGKIGQYWRRAIWRRLGRGRDRVFEVSITDPVFIAIFDATLDVTKGRS